VKKIEKKKKTNNRNYN